MEGWRGGCEDEWTVDGRDGWVHGHTRAGRKAGSGQKQGLEPRREDSTRASGTTAGRARAGRNGARMQVPAAPAALPS